MTQAYGHMWRCLMAAIISISTTELQDISSEGDGVVMVCGKDLGRWSKRRCCLGNHQIRESMACNWTVGGAKGSEEILSISLAVK